MHMEDEEILALVMSDQIDKGFDHLVRKYQEKLYWHIRRMVTFHEDADDVLQNTFIKIYKAIHNFKQDSSLYTWMYRIATNESLTFLKKRNRIMSKSSEEETKSLEMRLKADAFFDEQSVYLELQKAINSLPDKQKAVFNMRYFEETPYKEMSEILETSVGALKASYHHAVKKIETYLSNGSLNVG